VQSTLTDAGPFERILTVQLDEGELEPAKNAAARKLSRELKIKGFRPGKAPRAVVEKMVGPEALRGEAIEDGVPDLVNPALEDIDVLPVVAPRIEDIRDRIDGGIEVDIRITLWPTVERVPDIARKVTIDAPTVSDEEVDEQIDRLRSQYAELEDVNRAADTGDYVMINLSASANGKPVEDVHADDLLYEVGSQSYIPGLDEILGGASAGDIREGPATLPDGFDEPAGSEVTLRALVKGVRAKKLPEVTDEWVSDVSEFDDVHSLRDQLEGNLLAMKKNAAAGEYRQQLMQDITTELDVELPDTLVEAEMESSLHNMAHSLEQNGIDLATYLQLTGQDQNAFMEEVRAGATQSLKTRILLEGIAGAEGLEVGEDEIGDVLAEMAEPGETTAVELRDVLNRNGQITALTGDILRRKALDRILEESTPVDDDGNEVDLTIPEPPVADDDLPDDDFDDEADDEEPSGEAAQLETVDAKAEAQPDEPDEEV